MNGSETAATSGGSSGNWEAGPGVWSIGELGDELWYAQDTSRRGGVTEDG
jgi:hypothetical protein